MLFFACCPLFSNVLFSSSRLRQKTFFPFFTCFLYCFLSIISKVITLIFFCLLPSFFKYIFFILLLSHMTFFTFFSYFLINCSFLLLLILPYFAFFSFVILFSQMLFFPSRLPCISFFLF